MIITKVLNNNAFVALNDNNKERSGKLKMDTEGVTFGHEDVK